MANLQTAAMDCGPEMLKALYYKTLRLIISFLFIVIYYTTLIFLLDLHFLLRDFFYIGVDEYFRHT